MRKLVGEILIEDGDITKEQLNEALSTQRKEGGLLGTVLVNLDYITKEKLLQALLIQSQSVIRLAKKCLSNDEAETDRTGCCIK